MNTSEGNSDITGGHQELLALLETFRHTPNNNLGNTGFAQLYFVISQYRDPDHIGLIWRSMPKGTSPTLDELAKRFNNILESLPRKSVDQIISLVDLPDIVGYLENNGIPRDFWYGLKTSPKFAELLNNYHLYRNASRVDHQDPGYFEDFFIQNAPLLEDLYREYKGHDKKTEILALQEWEKHNRTFFIREIKNIFPIYERGCYELDNKNREKMA